MSIITLDANTLLVGEETGTIQVARISTYGTISGFKLFGTVHDMCLMRKAPVNNIVEVAIVGVGGITFIECFPNSNYTFKIKKDYGFDQAVTSVAVIEEGKSVIFSQ
jgi:hypothetical protein